MQPRELLNAMLIAERLKDTTRHCYTSKGRKESVAEHCWMITLMAFFVKREFPEADIEKVMTMCVIHDLGEAFTGDIPTFNKTSDDEHKEENLLYKWLETLPKEVSSEMKALYKEMLEQKTLESRIYKALDKLEAVIQHNMSDLDTWIPKEYELQKTYGNENVQFSEYFKNLRKEVLKDSLGKIGERQ